MPLPCYRGLAKNLPLIGPLAIRSKVLEKRDQEVERYSPWLKPVSLSKSPPYP